MNPGSGHFAGRAVRRIGAALRVPWVAPVLLLAVAAVVGALAFAYVSDVKDEVDRKEEAAQILSRMQTATARLGNLAALGSEPSLVVHAAADAIAVQQALGELLRRWDRVWWEERSPPAVVELRRTQAELTRRLRLALAGDVRAGSATTAELVRGDRLYHRIDDLRHEVSAEAADENAAGNTKTGVVTGVAIGFVVILLALIQAGRVRLARMQRETAMREALHEATRESEERYRYVTDLVPDQIFTIAPDGRFDYMNERTAAFLGRNVKDGPDRWLDLHHPDDAVHVQTTWSNSVHAGEPVEVESRMLGADGRYHWILTRAIPQKDEDGRIVRWFCSGTDITGRQRHEQELREARQRLAEAQAIAHMGSWEWDIASDEVRWSDELHRLYGVPADVRPGFESLRDLVHPDDRERVETAIRTALTERTSFAIEHRVIRPDGEERNFFSRGHVLTGGGDVPARVVGMAQDITDRVRAERERDRLEAELHLAERLTRRDVARPAIIDLNEVVHGRANVLRHKLGGDVTLELRLAADLWRIQGDREEIEQLLVQLAENARAAMPSGGVLRVETWNVEARGGRGPRVRVVVIDTGTGPPPDAQRPAFEAVYAIVRGAGGEVAVESEPGSGTRVGIELPAVAGPVPGAREDGGRGISGRILLVDDEEPVRRIASRILARHGYEVVAPDTPAEALAALGEAEGGEFDLLVTDIVMPEMSGRDLAERSHLVQPGLKVLFMSSYADRAGEVGAEAVFLPKPFDEQGLLGKVREALAAEREASRDPVDLTNI